MRKIIHVDMDAFFASVEIRDNPSLQNQPIAVGGAADKRGVISTANYIARTFGVHSAMPTAHALRKCPDLIVLPGSMEKYRSIAQTIREIFSQYTELVEPLSLDEAFLDVSSCTQCFGSATWMAQKIRYEIYQAEKLTASAGVSVNKFIAKVASDWNKPNGQFVVPPDDIDVFIKALPLKKIPGVGPKTSEKLHQLSLKTCGDVQKLSLLQLQQYVGVKFGLRLFDLCRAIDERPVEPNRVRKSVSVEETFAEDLQTEVACDAALVPLLSALQRRLLPYKDRVFNKIFVKIKFGDFSYTTVETKGSELDQAAYCQLLHQGMARCRGKSVRLLGIGIRFVQAEEDYTTTPQMSLF